MKERLLFIAKSILFSLSLFILWTIFLVKNYRLFLVFMMGKLYPLVSLLYHSTPIPRISTKHSYYLIPFIALVASTPKIKILGKIRLILAGTAIFFAFDFLTTLSGITQIVNISPHTLLSVTYHTVLLLLPILLWLIPTYQDLGAIFKTSKTATKRSWKHYCPVCKKKKTGLLDHIRSVHGKKALKSWRVRRFLANGL